MPRAIACSSCRQDKLRCDAHASAPDPCTRCQKRKTVCSIEPSFKRVATRNRLQHLTKEVQHLRESLHRTSIAASASSPENAHHTPRTSEHSSGDLIPLTVEPHSGNDDHAIFQLGSLTLAPSQVDELFQEYFRRYHPLFPLLNPAISPTLLSVDCPVLFWAIIATASRSAFPELYIRLCDLVTQLVSGNLFQMSTSVQPCQALLILCVFPFPTQTTREDVRWTYSGIAMQLALLAGLHNPGLSMEYQSASSIMHPTSPVETKEDRRESIRTWYCCCYVNAILGIELGLPSSIPPNTLTIERLNEAAFPIDFASSLRITYQSTKINGMLDKAATESRSTNLGLLRMLESDLCVVAELVKMKDATTYNLTTFSVLVAKLNLYSSGLKQAIEGATTEATQFRFSAFNCAADLIQLYSSAPFVTPAAGKLFLEPELPIQAYYPRSYWQSLVLACLMLLKLSHTKSLQEAELQLSSIAIQQAIDLLKECSYSDKDLLGRASNLLRFLNQVAPQELVAPRMKVRSRMGASLLYEMVYSTVALRKQAERCVEGRPKAHNLPPSVPVNSPDGYLVAGNDMVVDSTIEAFDLQKEINLMDFDPTFWDIGDMSVFDQVYCW